MLNLFMLWVCSHSPLKLAMSASTHAQIPVQVFLIFLPTGWGGFARCYPVTTGCSGAVVQGDTDSRACVSE